VVLGIPVFLLAIGLMTDLFAGLPFTRSAGSASRLVGGLIGLGALYAVGEGAVGWVVEKDKVTDPGWKRGLHLAALLAMLAVLAGFVVAVGLMMGIV
jgi:hypothetical protein